MAGHAMEKQKLFLIVVSPIMLFVIFRDRKINKSRYRLTVCVKTDWLVKFPVDTVFWEVKNTNQNFI